MFHVITGSPGTGKHTVAKLLADILDMPVVDINQEAASAGLTGPEGTDTDALAHVIKRRPGRALLVGHLAPYVVPPDLADSVVVLRRSPYELERIYRTRGYSRSKALSNLGAEILDVVAGEAASAFGSITEVDTTGQTPRVSAHRAAAAISGTVQSDAVDWLGMIHNNGHTGRFFELDK